MYVPEYSPDSHRPVVELHEVTSAVKDGVVGLWKFAGSALARNVGPNPDHTYQRNHHMQEWRFPLSEVQVEQPGPDQAA